MSAREIIAAQSMSDVSYGTNIAISIATVPIGGGTRVTAIMTITTATIAAGKEKSSSRKGGQGEPPFFPS